MANRYSSNLEKTLHKFGHKRVLTVYFTRKRHYLSVFAKRQLRACFIFSWRRWLNSLEILRSCFLNLPFIAEQMSPYR